MKQLLVVCVALPLFAQPKAVPKPPMVREGMTVKLSEHVWVIPDQLVGGVPNVGIIMGKRGMMIIDTGLGPRNAEAVLREAAKIGTRPEMYLVTTHFHPEHAGGGSAFPAKTKFVLSRIQQQDLDELGMGMMDVFSRMSPLHAELLKDVKFRKADVLFDRNYTVHLGGVDVELTSEGGTHTRGDTTAWVKQDRVLFSGDIVMNHAFLAFMKFSSAEKWLVVMDHLEKLKPKTIVPSHGPVGEAAMIGEQRGVIQALQARVRELKKQGKGVEESIPALMSEFEAKYAGWTSSTRIAPAVRTIWEEMK